MTRIPNIYGGGARTNLNGLGFEQTTSLYDALQNAGYEMRGIEIYKNGNYIGISAQKHYFYSLFLNRYGIDYININSKKWLPDEAFINDIDKVVYIIEKKFQNCSGSVDEKLPGCDFKKKEYEKLCRPIGYQVEYIYVFNDWFKQDIYRDVLEYIEYTGCKYFFNEIPLDFLGL